MDKLPALPDRPVSRDLIKEIAMDIGKSVVHYVEGMYPEAIKSTSSTFRLSLRNTIYNEIMAAIEVNDEGKIIDRIQDRKEWRRKMNKLRKLSETASPENAEETLRKLMEIK